MATGRPDPVEVWAPMFLFYSGTSTPKFKEEQILDPAFAITHGHCKLCDTPVTDAKTHMRQHRKELTAWLGKRRKESAKKSKEGLAAVNRERMLAAKLEADKIIANPGDYEEED